MLDGSFRTISPTKAAAGYPTAFADALAAVVCCHAPIEAFVMSLDDVIYIEAFVMSLDDIILLLVLVLLYMVLVFFFTDANT